MGLREDFKKSLQSFSGDIKKHITAKDGEWTIKGLIDNQKNIYPISYDTKIISKIVELHLYLIIENFAKQIGYSITIPEYQNYYPDITFVNNHDNDIKFAVDFKTTYRHLKNPELCNGFTLGSHGKYFKDRTSTKNIHHPYGEYSGHFCICLVYDRLDDVYEYDKTYTPDNLHLVPSIIKNFEVFVAEKWKIASDKCGSGNTSNIGSIKNITEMKLGNGIFSDLGEEVFDNYWINYGTLECSEGKKIKSLAKFVEYNLVE